jgi:segregation and condensation protein B
LAFLSLWRFRVKLGMIFIIMNLKKQIEALLFISNKPLDIKKLKDLTGRGKEEIETVVLGLKKEYNGAEEKGIKILEHNDKIQMTTDGECAEVVEKFLKQELTGEMTRPQLETLTIIAYRGPISKAELEQIRGVNCSLILRNLLMRGLVEGKADKKMMVNKYSVTEEFVKYLGMTEINELPDFEKLSQHESIDELLSREQ